MKLVSVLLPAYNAAPFLREALESILSQDYRAIEVVVVDDGSTDSTAEIARQVRDERVRVEANPKNLGLIRTLNRGLGLVRGDYVARMDADDVCKPGRLRRQVEMLERDTSLGVVSSRTQDFSETSDGRREFSRAMSLPISHAEIVATMPFFNSVSHATCMVRREVIERFAPKDVDGGRVLYDVSFPHAEDYELWSRLAKGGVKFANTGEVHLERRVHGESVSVRESSTQTEVADRVRADWHRALGIPHGSDIAHVLNLIGRDMPPRDGAFPAVAEPALLEIRTANRRQELFEPAALDRVLEARWWRVCFEAVAGGGGFPVFQRAIESDLLLPGSRFSLRAASLLSKSLGLR